MAKVVTEYDIELAKWNAKIAQIKADMKSAAAAAKKEGLGEKMFGGLKDAVGAFSLGAFVAQLREVTSHYDEISDAADKMGESTDVIQRVGFAASQSGTSIDALNNSFIKLEKALGDVENAGAREALANLGITAEQIAEMPLDEKIIALSKAFDTARANGTGMNDIMTLLGRSAADLIPLLSQGEEGIRSMLADAPVLAADAVDALSELNDEIDALGSRAQTVFGKFAVNLGMQLSVLKTFLTTGATLDQALDYEADQMNERREATAKRRKRPRTAANTEDAAAAAKQLKEDADAAKKAADEEEARAKRIDKLKADIENKRVSMLPDDQQLAEYKAKLQALYEDVNFVDATMDGLDEAIRMAVDAADEERLLGLKKQAMEWQSEIDSLAEKGQKTKTETVKTASTPGDVAAAINTIFGRSANELILDESKRQTQIMERMDKSLQKIADGDSTDPFNQEVFAFP